MKTKIVFLLGLVMTLAFFQMALGEPVEFSENPNDSITIKRSGGYGICTVPLKKGPIRGEIRPDGNINVYYRDGSRSIVILDNNKPKRIEEYNSKNRNTKKLVLDPNICRLQYEESYGRNGKKNGFTEYKYRSDGTRLIKKSWAIDKNGDIIEKEYFHSDIDTAVFVNVKDKFGNMIVSKVYIDGKLGSTSYYKDGKLSYIEYADGRIDRYDKDGKIIDKDKKLQPTLAEKFARDLLALGKDRETTKTNPPTPSPGTPSPSTPSPSTPSPGTPSPSTPKPSTGDPSLVGTWEERDEDDGGGPFSGLSDSYITFHEDGRFENFAVVVRITGKYAVEGDTLKFYGDNGELAHKYNFKIEGNRLTLNDGTDVEVYYRKN